MGYILFFRFKATIIQARRMSFLKEQLDAIFKGNKNRPSVIFRIKPSKSLRKDYSEFGKDYKSLSSYLCLNKRLAKIDDLLWCQENAKLYTIYPQQKVEVSRWMTYPSGKSFPLFINNSCQISSESDLYILVEVFMGTYNPKASTSSAKLEDYGLITAWTASVLHINFILKTDLEHITSFMSKIMQGQYYVNLNFFVTRIQTVIVWGQPRLYNHDTTKLSGPPKNINLFRLIYTTAEAKAVEQKIPRRRGMSGQSQNKNSNEFTEEFFEEAMKNIGAKSNSAPPTCASSPTREHVGLVKNPYNLKYLPDAVCLAVMHGGPPDYTNVHLPPNATKDNTNDEQSKNIDQNKSTKETESSDSKNSELEEKEKPSTVIKPPNVLICADIESETDNLTDLLLQVLEEDRYVIHIFSKGEYDRCKVWMDQVSLVVLCGNVGAELGAHLVEYIIQGGKLLALCSDMLHILLPSFKTGEVRENELVHFSYGKWKRVRMMHHIFCYHASPIRTRFSQDHEDTRAPAVNPPTSTSIKDRKGNLHSFDVKVLGREETWQSPSILLATLPNSNGKVVFSQIHLEIDPMKHVYEEDKNDVLKKSNAARLEIISDLLSTHLGLDVNRGKNRSTVKYTPGYFLGKFEMKMKMLEKLKNTMSDNELEVSNLTLQFCANKKNMESPSADYLPIMMHMCPPHFSTVDYFENLFTKALGRLVIYTDVLTSSMNVVSTELEHGLVVIPQQQTKGRGRHYNKWLGPKGCAMFTLQVHLSIESTIGPYISILQHIAAVALVSAVRSIKGYEDIDLRIKWPNDIYIGNSIKIGGIIVKTLLQGGGPVFVSNIGAGVNLSNSKPTSCINDAILQYNQKHGTKLKALSLEKYLALVFNEMEILLDTIQSGNVDYFYQLYYKYWLHTNSKVWVTFINGRREEVTILGIDKYGYLLVQGTKGMFSVHSDENTFDVLKGLIVPKHV